MAGTPVEAQSAPVTPFDPAAWLSRFKDVGGWWVISAGGKVTMGWMLDGFTPAQNEDALLHWKELSGPDRKVAVARHIQALAGEVCHD